MLRFSKQRWYGRLGDRLTQRCKVTVVQSIYLHYALTCERPRIDLLFQRTQLLIPD
jgi:hypothetical protein